MNQDEYEQLTHVDEVVPTIMAAELYAGGSRTLLYGYDIDRNTWHVYLLGGSIHRRIYTLHRTLSDESSLTWRVSDLVPNKRAYPERTDFRFASICAQRGEPIIFTTFREGIEPAQFYGEIA